jgi:hypothetical protein
MKVYLFNEFFYLIILTVQKCSLEDNDHFLFNYPKYNNLRLILLESIQELIPKNNNADINIVLCLHYRSHLTNHSLGDKYLFIISR